MSLTPILLNIADFVLELRSGDGTSIKLDEGFNHFYLENDSKSTVDTNITCFGKIPEDLKAPKNSLYKAVANSDLLWEIFESSTGLQFMVYDPENTSVLQQVALFNEANQNWTIYSEKVDSKSVEAIFPLQYPLSPLIMYYLILHKDAIMIHASGVYDGKEGRIFSGFSGVGKSTMAGLWNQRESMVVNDDRLILRKINGDYWMYNTPMYYPDESRKAPLSRVYLPFHSPKNSFERIKVVRAVAEMMAFCIQHGYRRKNTSAHFDFISELTQNIPVAKVGVVPTTEIIDFIRSNDEKMD